MEDGEQVGAGWTLGKMIELDGTGCWAPERRGQGFGTGTSERQWWAGAETCHEALREAGEALGESTREAGEALRPFLTSVWQGGATPAGPASWAPLVASVVNCFKGMREKCWHQVGPVEVGRHTPQP